MAHLLAITLAVLVAGCTSEPPAPAIADPSDPVELGRLFTRSREYRRAVLERSLVSRDNLYGAVRLANYATVEGGWDVLPLWLPEVRPLSTRTSEASDDWAVEWTHEGLMRAGEHAFMNFPMRSDPRLEPLRNVREETAGFWMADGRIGGLVEVDDGLGWTCATCHAQVDDAGRLAIGVPNAKISLAELYHAGGTPNSLVEKWRAGTLDPSADGTDNPSTIGDLRAVRFQSHLHWTGTLRNSLAALAIRVETLYIVSTGELRRPPREVAFAIAYYLWNLGVAPAEQRSEAFETNCGTCHHADGSVGAPLPWAEPHPARGTGYHRVPSLVGVSDRGRLLHDGSIGSVDELMESGPPWHAYGKTLTAAQRADLAAYVREHFAL